MEKVIQFSEIFKLLGVKDCKNSKMIFKSAIKFLCYMNINSKLKIEGITITKISDDLFHIDSAIDYNTIISDMNDYLVLKLKG
jgi:hypothetical protein